MGGTGRDMGGTWEGHGRGPDTKTPKKQGGGGKLKRVRGGSVFGGVASQGGPKRVDNTTWGSTKLKNNLNPKP